MTGLVPPAIGYLRPDELPAFWDFLENHWRPGHALAVSPPLMNWMYLDRERGHYRFVIARDPRDRQIAAVLGFLPLCHFDPALGGRDIWLQLWKVRDDRRGLGLGTALFQFLKKEWHPRSVCGFGLSEGVKRTYARLGFTLGVLNHYYRVNPASPLRLLRGPVRLPPRSDRPADGLRWVRLADPISFDRWAERLDWRTASQMVPAKSAAYFRGRYFDHPVYRYEVLALAREQRALGIVVLRQAFAGGASALKWVDYGGDFESLGATGGIWNEVLAETGAEYIELHNLGIPSGILARAGFHRRFPGSEAIVPSYFEPFEARNVDIAYAHWTWSDARYCIFKGDSDQDRPSIIPAAASRGVAVNPHSRPSSPEAP
jgi:GNAT superfamily N-acetyltransferase